MNLINEYVTIEEYRNGKNTLIENIIAAPRNCDLNCKKEKTPIFEKAKLKWHPTLEKAE